MQPWSFRISDGLGHQLQAGRAEKIEIVIHRSQRRTKKFRFRHIIETDHRVYSREARWGYL